MKVLITARVSGRTRDANMKIALGMVKTRRMHIGASHKVKDTHGLQAILAKAAEIDARESKGGA